MSEEHCPPAPARSRRSAAEQKAERLCSDLVDSRLWVKRDQAGCLRGAFVPDVSAGAFQK